MQASDKTMKEKMKARAKIKKSMISVLAGLDVETAASQLPVSSRLLTDLTETISAEDLGKQFELDDVAWGKLVGKAIALAPTAKWRWRTRALHSTKRHYLRASGDQLHGAAERLFETEITPANLQQVNTYDGYVDKAMAPLQEG